MNTLAALKLPQEWKKQVRSKQLFYYLFFGVIGLGLLYFLIQNQGKQSLLESLKKVNYWWALPIFFIAVFNNIIRSLRWLLLLKTLGHRPGLLNAFNALMFGYMVNYAIPRMGEITRCIALKKSVNIPFKSALGTVITERIIDVLSLLIVCMLAVSWAYNEISSFVLQNIVKPLLDIFVIWSGNIWYVFFALSLFLALSVLILGLFKSQLINFAEQKQLKQRLLEVWRGIISIKNVEKPLLFFVYTILIWLNYFLSTYLWFFAFDIEPSIKVGLVVMAMGSIAKSLPIQGGGLGAYHFVVAQAIVIFGFTQLQGNTLAIVNHGFQTVYQIGLGVLGMIYFARKIKSHAR